MYYFDLLDIDGKLEGAIQTDLPADKIQNEWAFYIANQKSNYLGIDEFIELMKIGYPNHTIKRFRLNSIFYPNYNMSLYTSFNSKIKDQIKRNK